MGGRETLGKGAGMRNAKPVIFEDVNITGGVSFEAGIERGDLEVTLAPGDFDRLKSGYLCPRCWEQQPEAFPEKCEVLDFGDGERGCGFPIRKQLTEWLQQNHVADRWIGPSTSDDEEIEILRDHRARKKHNPDAHIWLPGDPFG